MAYSSVFVISRPVLASIFSQFQGNGGFSAFLPFVLDFLALCFLCGGLYSLLLLRHRAPQTEPRPKISQGRGRLSLACVILVPLLLLFLVGVDMYVYAPSFSSARPIAHATGLPVVNSGVLDVVTDANYPPQTYVDQDGHIVGFDIDLIGALAHTLHLKVVLKNDQNFAQLTDYLQNNTADAVISAYALNSDILSNTSFIPYLNPGEILLVPKNNPEKLHFAGWGDLCGRTIGVLLNSNEDLFLRTLRCPTGSQLKLDELSTIDGVAQELIAGKVDVTYQDSPTGTYYTDLSKYAGQLQPLGEMLQGIPEGILVRNNQTLFNALQRAYQAVVQEGTYTQLLQRWHLEDDAL